MPLKVGEAKALKGLDLSTYRNFSEASANWALGDDLKKVCSTRMKRSLRASFDRSVLTWHIAIDLCFRMMPPLQDTASPSSSHSQQSAAAGSSSSTLQGWSRSQARLQHSYSDKELHLRRRLCTQAISNYMAHLLSFRPEMLMTGSRKHLFTRAQRHMERILAADAAQDIRLKLQRKQHHLDGADLMRMKQQAAATAAADDSKHITYSADLIGEACELAEELMGIDNEETRVRLMYRVWLGMLCYSASMCRGYLHAKSLGEGGEFLSVIWLIISLKGGKTLADKLQMPETEEGHWDWNDVHLDVV